MSEVLASFPSLPVAEIASIAVGQGLDYPFGAALGARHVLRRGLGEGHRDYLTFPRGLQVAHSRFRPAVDSLGRCEGRNLFKMHFNLDGRNRVRYEGQAELVAATPSVSISLHPAGVSKSDFHPQDCWEHSVTLVCPASFFADALRLDFDGLPAQLARFAMGCEPQLFMATGPLPGRARRLIEDLLAPPCSSRVAHLHAEARSIDLLCVGLELFTEQPDAGGRGGISRRDQRSLQALRERLASDFLLPASIHALARAAGMNRTKLTTGFRALFGESIGDYLTRLRMQHACHMLDQGFSAAAVAAELGYRHQSSFATAFRAYIGSSPSRFRTRGVPARSPEKLSSPKQGRSDS